MSNVASVYSELGRRQDALAMNEKSLEFHRRVLPANHPHIGVVLFCELSASSTDVTLSTLGTSMGNLARSYSESGRHQDSLVMMEKTLEFQQHVLPWNDRRIGAVLSYMYIYIFWIFLFGLVTSKFFSGEAMLNLANGYSGVGRHQEALVMEEKTLEFQRRVLPANHPHIGAH